WRRASRARRRGLPSALPGCRRRGNAAWLPRKLRHGSLKPGRGGLQSGVELSRKRSKILECETRRQLCGNLVDGRPGLRDRVVGCLLGGGRLGSQFVRHRMSPEVLPDTTRCGDLVPEPGDKAIAVECSIVIRRCDERIARGAVLRDPARGENLL